MTKKFEILLATINQDDDSVLNKMNVHSDIIVCNQNKKRFDKKIYKKDDYNVEWYNLSEYGVGLNRNNALMRSTADICLLADDDVTYLDNYDKIILDRFDEFKNADVILFNTNPDQKSKKSINKVKKINKFNCGGFGGVRIAFRRNKVIKKSISFNLLFGGGAKYNAGEDVLFVRECIKKGLKVLAVPDYILFLRNERQSTWFKDYDEKFFHDVGASYYAQYGHFAYLIALLQLKRKRKKWLINMPESKAKKCIREGINDFIKL